MKIKDVHITKGALGDTIYVCTISKKCSTIMLQKEDRTNEFLRAVIDRWEGYEEVITNNIGERFKISCKRIKSKESK